MSQENSGGEAINPESAPGTVDRRTRSRFPLRLAVSYRRIGSPVKWVSGESLNISSTGLLFTATETVQPGQGIEAFIAWPVCLDSRVALKLVIKGCIVRNIGDQSAVCFERYEFKTSQMPANANPKTSGQTNLRDASVTPNPANPK